MVCDLAHSDRVQAERIGPIGRARRKDPSEPTVWVRARMNFQDVAPGFVQPGHNDEFVPSGHTIKSLRSEGTHLQPGVGSAFGGLFWRLATRLDIRSNHANRAERRRLAVLATITYRPRSFLSTHRKPVMQACVPAHQGSAILR